MSTNIFVKYALNFLNRAQQCVRCSKINANDHERLLIIVVVFIVTAAAAVVVVVVVVVYPSK